MAKQNKGTSVFNENNLLKHPNTPIAYACPSCINYYQSKDEFKSHVLDMHVMIISRGSSPDRENGWMIDGVDILEEHFRYRDECSRRYKNGTIVFTEHKQRFIFLIAIFASVAFLSVLYSLGLHY